MFVDIFVIKILLDGLETLKVVSISKQQRTSSNILATQDNEHHFVLLKLMVCNVYVSLELLFGTCLNYRISFGPFRNMFGSKNGVNSDKQTKA